MLILFDFTAPKYFDGLEHNYDCVYIFPRANVFGKFLLYNRKICSANVVKTQVCQNLYYGGTKIL